MAHLLSLKHEKLTEAVLKSLKNNNIYNVVDFVRHDTESLVTITRLPFNEILDIRRFILHNHTHLVNGLDYHKKILESFAILPTCILSLDNLLQGGLRCQKITELCGLPDSGKTLLTLSIVCNISSVLKQEVLYIDTKNDFDGKELLKIMQARSKLEDVNDNLIRVKVAKLWDMRSCLSFLHDLYTNEEQMKNIKLIVVDSLPALVLQYRGGNSHREGLGYLNNFVNIIRRLGGKYNIPFLVTNLLTRWVEPIAHKDGDSATNYNIEVKPTLGRYWSHIPYTSLDVTKKSDQDITVSIRTSYLHKDISEIAMKISENGVS